MSNNRTLEKEQNTGKGATQIQSRSRVSDYYLRGDV